MRLGDRRRSFPGDAAERRLRAGGAAWPPASDSRGRAGQTVGRCVSLGLAGALVGALLYALFKFFDMVRAIRMDPRDLWFVPVVIVAVILLVIFRVVRPLLREILTKSSPR